MNTDQSSLGSINRIVWIALMAALTAVGAVVSIPMPISPVPVTLQTMFVLLAGFILGPKGGALAMMLYLAAGCLGLPVFSGGKAGLAVFLGPTGGFLAGFIPAAIVCGLAKSTSVKPYWVLLIFSVVATAITLALGTIQLSLLLKISIGKAMAVGVIPFLPGAAIKCFGAAFIYRFLAIRRLIPT